MRVEKHDMADAARYKTALDRVFAYGKQQEYAGYSKFDALNSPLLNTLSFGVSPVKWAYAQAVYRFPVNIRPLLGVRKGINPKAVGLFALAYLTAAQAVPERADAYIAEARWLLDWLDSHRAEGWHGASCGYNYVWPNLRFTAPANFPNLVVTGNVMIAFLTAYELLGEQRYLDTARSSIDFILHDLTTVIDTAEDRAISYVPGSSWIVLNNQGLAAVLMAWTAKHTGESELKALAQRHVQFLVKQQTTTGAWFYAYPPESSPVTHDNYHTGNVLDWLLYYKLHSGDNQFKPAYERGLAFYRENLFTPDNAPKHRHNVVYPHDVHSAAQGAITFARAAMHHDPRWLPDAERFLTWGLDNFSAGDGGFYYQKGRLGTNKTRLMHWNEGLMAVSLAHILRARQILAPEVR